MTLINICKPLAAPSDLRDVSAHEHFYPADVDNIESLKKRRSTTFPDAVHLLTAKQLRSLLMLQCWNNYSAGPARGWAQQIAMPRAMPGVTRL